VTKRIFRTIFIVAVATFLICAVLFMTVFYDGFSSVQQNQLKMQTELAAKGVQNEGLHYLTDFSVNNLRITWIGTDGGVLYDGISAAWGMENHFMREEVKEALAKGYGSSSRYSSTLTERYLYSAKLLSDGTVIRLAVTHNSLLSLTFEMLPTVLGIFIIAIGLSAVLALRLSKNIVKPLNELDLDKPLENNGYDEILPLLKRIDTQQTEIKRQSDELKKKKNEFEVMTSSMSEGIVLLNQKGTILSVNKAAEKLFNTDSLSAGMDILSSSHSEELKKLLSIAELGRHSEIIMEFEGGKYQVDASPVVQAGAVSGIVLLLLDVTEKAKNEVMRREFTANVSHELKTPLHTISGSAELMANGMVKPEDVPEFSKRIYAESQRMIRLVEDIIKLSHLDEGAEDMKRDMVDLYALAEETVRSLSPEAAGAGIRLELYGETAYIYGIRQLLQGIVFNLCDNAIKYNREGGYVTVEIKNTDDFIVLSVADSGIGIPAEHQERVFERFYRVDKSHSKEIGGTGLGLSIVKHAAKLHSAEIELDSAAGEGTAVRVKFPKTIM